MAETKFVSTVLGAFNVAKAELLEDGADENNVCQALSELKPLLELVSKSNFGDLQSRHKYAVGGYYSMLNRMACQWYKQFMRRMTTRFCVRNPWKVLLEVSLPKELFNIMKEIVARTNFGVFTGETKSKTAKKSVIAFTSYARVRSLFIKLMDSDMPRADFLRKKFKGLKRIEAIINEDHQFGMLYDQSKEVMCFDFSYGYWNDHGFPQHITVK